MHPVDMREYESKRSAGLPKPELKLIELEPKGKDPRILFVLFENGFIIGLNKMQFWNIWVSKTDFGDPLPPP